jgi:D-glycero-D-manno-heptose 1,7-bisphosphate phosphatase
MLIKTIFLDRDGVINKEVNYLHKIEDFEFIEGVFKACLYLQNLGYKIIIITNQSGISRGYYDEADFSLLNKWMLNYFKKKNINILDVYHCPHGPKTNCFCRKPKPGMILEAKKIHNIDLQKSWIIGDRENDISAGKNAGIKNTILLRSGHKIENSGSKALHILDSIKDINKVILK